MPIVFEYEYNCIFCNTKPVECDIGREKTMTQCQCSRCPLCNDRLWKNSSGGFEHNFRCNALVTNHWCGVKKEWCTVEKKWKKIFWCNTHYLNFT